MATGFSAGETTTSYADLLKEWYTPRRVETIVFADDPCLAMMPKNTEIEGETWDIPLIYGDPPAASATFSAAQNGKGAISADKFQVTMKDEYGLAGLERKLLKAARTSRGTFLPKVTPQIDGAFRQVKRAMAIKMWGRGYGTVCQTSAAASSIITLNPTSAVVMFQKGDRLQFADAATGGTLRNSNGIAKVTDVNRSAGKLTLADVDASTVAAITADDFVLRSGDYDESFTGVRGWIPTVDDGEPTSTAFFGVDRTSDTGALGGIRYDASAQLVHEGLIDGLDEINYLGGGKPDHAFIHQRQWRNLAKEMGAKVELNDYAVSQEISFAGFVVRTSYGSCRIFPARYIGEQDCWALQLDCWEFGSMGMCPEIFDEDLELLREATTDGFEMRVGGYLNLACHAPGYNGHIKLPALL